MAQITGLRFQLGLTSENSQNIVVEAYSPLGNNIYNLPRAVDDSTVVSLASDIGKDPAQVLISWAIQRGTVVLPKSVTPSRIKSNLQTFELSDDVFQKILSLDRHHRYNFPARLGVDIFDEVSPESLRKSVEDWKEAQRKLRAGQ
ncbi:aldehyde reductase 1 protein [Rutstroemia sp. NJR-2017a BBW]|nr:aldehyde reductase 1 protein [Rutstroemia sp. NJR-2017a BBW]